MTMDKFLSNTDPKLANVTNNIEKNSNGNYVANFTLTFAYEFSDLKIITTFAVCQNEKDQDYQKILLKSSINFCNMLEGRAGDFVTKTFLDALKKSADFAIKCPFPKV